MDMNKYLLVALYVVAGCTVITPAEGSNIANKSHQIWVELNTILEENQVLLDDILREQNEPADIATLKSCIAKILSSFYYIDTQHTFDSTIQYDSVLEYNYQPKSYVIKHRNTSIQARAPDLV